MRAKFGSVEVEGSPDELAAFFRAADPFALAVAVKTPVGGNPARKFVDEDVAFRAIKRRPLSAEQSTILRTLRDHHPDWTLATQLRKATKYNASQLAGILGAFGKRIAATPGYESGTWFFDQEWNYDSDCYSYRLPESVHAAVLRAGL